MRLQCPNLLPEERRCQGEFANRLLAVGEGRDNVNDTIRWPVQGIVPDNSVQSLAGLISPNVSTVIPSAEFLASRILLALRNDTVSDLNKMLLQLMPGQQHIFKSADSIVDDDGLEVYPTEYLNTIDVSNIPLHELNLKIGVILLRNLNPNAGLCNGCGDQVVECEILCGKHVGEKVIIPEFQWNLRRRQSFHFSFEDFSFLYVLPSPSQSTSLKDKLLITSIWY
jgi:hypothetical protein